VVSGCTSIDEFVAAFRRHARRDDLFVPTQTPLAAGGRGRVVITLRDGRVVIDGQVTVVATARDKGCKGMTLRFSALDGDSRAMLDHLDRERFRAKMTPVPGVLVARPGTAPIAEASAPPAQADCVVVGRLPSADDPDEDAEVDADRAEGRPTQRMREAIAPALAPRPTMRAPVPPAKIAVGSRPLVRVARTGTATGAPDVRPMWIPIALLVAVGALLALAVHIAR
jgi:hypothetical protein